VTLSNSSYNNSQRESTNPKNTDSISKHQVKTQDKVKTTPFSFSSSDVKDYNIDKEDTIVADRFIPIRKNNKTTLAFSDVMDDEA